MVVGLLEMVDSFGQNGSGNLSWSPKSITCAGLIFKPLRCLSIIKEEGLKVSQPALDPVKSAMYHSITTRRQHMMVVETATRTTPPPCVGWVELMAPVFSRAAWHCTWYMIQNDLIHAWGLDLQLGYCAQGDQTTKVGVTRSILFI